MIKKISITILFLFSLVSCNDESDKVSSEIKQIATQVNKKCPQMIDSETRLDGISFLEPSTIVYKYTLVNLLAENLDTAKFYTAMWPGLLSTIKISPEMKSLREANTEFHYDYKDKNNKGVYLFKILPKDYK